MRKAELTELQRVKIENYNLRAVFMQQQLQQIQVERATFIRQIEDENPGYEWRDPHGLVSKEDMEREYSELTPQ